MMRSAFALFCILIFSAFTHGKLNVSCTTNGSDGYSGAPAVSAQLPTLLSSYTAKPSWCVAGVGYGVGYPSGQTLTDWQSISQTGVSVNTSTGQIYIASGSPTLNGIDFTLHGGSYIYIDNSSTATGLTITNSNFGAIPVGPSYNIQSQKTNFNLTIEDNIFNGGTNSQTSFIGFQSTGTVILEYNIFENGLQHVIEQVSGTLTLTYKFNLIENMAQAAGAHDNWVQWGTIGTGSTADVEYNTGYTNFLNTGVGAGEGFQFYANSSGTLGTTTLANNTMIAVKYNGAATMSSIVHGGTASSGTNSNNYFDCSGCGSALPAGAYYTGSMTAADGWTSSGNIDMNTGSTITPN